jgi:hypothetical protein
VDDRETETLKGDPQMKIRTLSILALCAVAAVGCKKSDTAEGTDTTTSDTSVVPGMDSAQVTVPVQTQDTVVQTTTTETDTIKGDTPDTVHTDTAKH